MTRRGLREQVFKMLFRVEFHNVEDMPEQMNMFEEVEECSEKDKEYISNKFHNIVEKIDEIDAAINEVSEGWKTRRMGKVDLTLIRLAVYEMKYEDDIPVKLFYRLLHPIAYLHTFHALPYKHHPFQY